MKMTSKAGHVSCAVDGCKAVQKSLHSLPKDGNLRNAWLEFIFNHKVPLHVSPHLCVCSAHFSSDCMENQARYAAGFAKKLILRPGAIPTIWDPTTVKIEQCNYTSKPTPRDVACQTDPPQRKSVGTQLSWSLQQHFRSRGYPSRSPGARDDEEASPPDAENKDLEASQATAQSVSAGVEIERISRLPTAPPPSAPAPAKDRTSDIIPSKRTRLECDDTCTEVPLPEDIIIVTVP